MASAMIHLAVANEINKTLKRQNNKLLIGSIAPDIAKIVGETKLKSHFQNQNDGIPDLDRFFKKYGNRLDDDFVLGYYIHLYTDYLWYKYFMDEIFDKDKNIIKKLNGEEIKCEGGMKSLYIYNDYTDINIKLIEEYNLDLKIFYNEPPELENIIEEIPMNKINLLIDKMGLIATNTKSVKGFTFDITNVKKFISTSVELILSILQQKIS